MAMTEEEKATLDMVRDAVETELVEVHKKLDRIMNPPPHEHNPFDIMKCSKCKRLAPFRFLPPSW